MRKYFDKGGRALIIAAGIGAMFISSWIIVSVAQLAMALVIAAVTIKMLPVLWQALTYGQVASLLAIAKKSPIPVLERRKVDYLDDIRHTAKSLVKMISSREQTLAAHRKVAERDPTRAEMYRSKIEMVERGVEYKKAALQRARTASARFDDLLELARVEWDLQVSLKGALAMMRSDEQKVLNEMMENEAFRSIENELTSAFSALEAAMAMDDEAISTIYNQRQQPTQQRQAAPIPLESSVVSVQNGGLFNAWNTAESKKKKV